MVLCCVFFCWLIVGLMKQDPSDPKELFLSNTFGLIGALLMLFVCWSSLLKG